MKERVAFLIVNWNSTEMLRCCLDSVHRQDYQAKDVLVLDNSSDEPLSEDFFSSYPQVQFYRSHRNLGFAAGNNFLFSKIPEYEWVVLVNPDAFLEPDWLSKMISAVNDHPEYSFFASRLVQNANRRILDGDGDTMHLSGWAWRKGNCEPVPHDVTKPYEVFSACAAAALYQRNVFESLGGFDEDFFCYFEDVDLGFRMRLAGHRCLFVPDAVAYHVGASTTGNRHSDFVVYHGHRNMVWTYVKNMPGVLFWLLLPAHIVINIVTIIWFSMRGQSRIILKAKWHALCGIHHMWKKRHDIQGKRNASVGDIWKILDKSFFPRLSQFRWRYH